MRYFKGDVVKYHSDFTGAIYTLVMNQDILDGSYYKDGSTIIAVNKDTAYKNFDVIQSVGGTWDIGRHELYELITSNTQDYEIF